MYTSSVKLKRKKHRQLVCYRLSPKLSSTELFIIYFIIIKAWTIHTKTNITKDKSIK